MLVRLRCREIILQDEPWFVCKRMELQDFCQCIFFQCKSTWCWPLHTLFLSTYSPDMYYACIKCFSLSFYHGKVVEFVFAVSQLQAYRSFVTNRYQVSKTLVRKTQSWASLLSDFRFFLLNWICATRLTKIARTNKACNTARLWEYGTLVILLIKLRILLHVDTTM